MQDKNVAELHIDALPNLILLLTSSNQTIKKEKHFITFQKICEGNNLTYRQGCRHLRLEHRNKSNHVEKAL